MNNNLLLAAQKWLIELGIKTEITSTVLKINRQSVTDSGLFDSQAALLSDLKLDINKKLYFESVKDDFFFHLNSF